MDSNSLTLMASLIFFFIVLFHATAVSLNPADLAALATIKDTLTDIPGTHFLSTWDFTSPDPCSSFSGITCSSDNRVTLLTLGTGFSDSPGLAGTLSPALSNLTQLTQLVLFPGLVTGPIPPPLGLLSNLQVISLTNNRLTGPIPHSLSYLPNLHTLDLSSNQLTGSIPPGLSELPTLRVLILGSNQLSGELPSTVSAQLLHLDLRKNRISGPLPQSLPSSLRYLSMSENSMWGPLNGLELLPDLLYLDLSMNQFSGPIPPPLFNPTLSSMFLQRNNLSGGVPPVSPPPPYNPGSIVDLSHNFLSGELSPILTGVESLFLNNNRLSGLVPEEYVKSAHQGTTKTLYLQHNFFTGFPMGAGLELPDTVALCLTYNCMVPSVGISTCPASAGGEISRPLSQCSVSKNRSSTD
ncbi:hypothetical protein SLE2022_106580 [Rubroshorea leprosula]